jgi:hypothetical protein
VPELDQAPTALGAPADDGSEFFLTKLIHNNGADEIASIAIGVGVTLLWLANRGRRRRLRDSTV